MKKNKGFTLIELMIVVAIIGILAAIAIPNFLRYQLRSKASERKMNVDAIYKAEESGRQREGGSYVTLAATPAGQTAGSQKLKWAQGDYSRAGAIDWVVQGATYGVYATTATNGLALSICGWTDIDGDGVFAADALWNPVIKADGTFDANNLPAAAPCATGTDVTKHALTFASTVGTDVPGQATQLSADSVF